MSIYEKQRNFLHPVSPGAGALKTRHFQTTDQGTTAGGVRLRRIESNHPAVHASYKHGVMVEAPNTPPYIVYGKMDEINQVAASLKKDPDSVYKTLRFAGQSRSNQYYLNDAAPPKMTNDLSASEMDRASAAHKMFPDQGSESRPLTRKQEEFKAAVDHVKSVAESTTIFPSSTEGKAKVDNMVNAAADAAKAYRNTRGGAE